MEQREMALSETNKSSRKDNQENLSITMRSKINNLRRIKIDKRNPGC